MIGQTISHYKILEKLGEGGMGVVYKAEDTKLKRTVALKFLPHHLTADETEQARFLQEAQAAATINHPNVCTIYDIKEDTGRQFIIMEYVEGTTLRTVIPVQKLHDALSYSMQIAAALQAAHAKGIVHRDIKSENVMIAKDGTIRVTDFGLAKLKGGLDLTKAGTTVGTSSYMSPEQIQNLEVDARSDLWSFGIVLYEMFTGHRPFQGGHEAAIMYEILNLEPKEMTAYRQDIPGYLQILVSRLLQKDPAKRISSAAEVIEQLKTPAPVASSPHTEMSVAVRYFENMSSEKESEYFCAGMTEDLITDLSKIKGLKVVSRTDVLPFRNKEVNTRQIGEMFKVHYVLEGSVRKAGNKMRIAAQLIDVHTGFHVWVERFDRLVEDIFDIQTEVSQKIADAMKVSLTQSEKESIAQKPTDDLRAYDFYLRGRELLYRRGKKNTEAAIQMFENAFALDPKFASAYAGLAEAYSYMYEWYDGSSVWLGKAIEMNQKALNFEPNSLEAKFGIAIVYFYQRRFQEAKHALEGIIKEHSQFYPAYLRLGMTMEVSDDIDSALRYYQQASELKPHDEEPWIRLDSIYRRIGDMRAAQATAMKIVEVTSQKLDVTLDDIIVMSRLARAYAQFGAKEEAHAAINRVFEIDITDGLAAYNCASAYGLMGEKDRALLSLRRAFDNGFRAVANWINTDAAFDSLRDDAELHQFIRSCNNTNMI